MPGLLELAGRDQTAREMLLRRWVGLDPAAAMEAAAPKLLLNNSAQVAAWAKALDPAGRSAVADQLEKSLHNISDAQRRELIAPLR